MTEPTAARASINAIPLTDQAQYGTDQQLLELYYAAIRLGLYDAADAVLAMRREALA